MIGAGFRLGEATAAERIARDRLTYEAWGERLTREQYLDRERILRQTAHGRLDMHTWVLRLPNDVVVASAETFRLPLLPAGAIEVIATVYVDRPLRGVKMGSRLMAALVASRREAGLDALILFSEVGTDIYARQGFKALPAPTRSWTQALAPLSEAIEPLVLDGLPEALAWRDRARQDRIDLRVTDTAFRWHWARTEFYAWVLGRPARSVIGARVGDVQLLWVPDFKHDVLRILDATGPAGADLEPAIAGALAEARMLGLPSVELWDDAASVLLTGGTPLERTDDIPMGISFTPRGELFLGPLSRASWA